METNFTFSPTQKRGMPLPFMSEEERLSIEKPWASEMVFQTDSDQGVYIFTPNGWQRLLHSGNFADLLKEPAFLAWESARLGLIQLQATENKNSVKEILAQIKKKKPWYQRLFV